ncbi:MAG: GNAT family N-acetyltransferase [Terriglobales bacterium]
MSVLLPPAMAGTLPALERDWKQLQRKAGAINPFLSWEWQNAWAETMDYPALVIAQPFPDGSLAGVLALQRRRRRGLVQWEFLGQGSGGDELDCLLHPDAPPETAARLLQTAMRQPHWHLLRLESADASGALARSWPPERVERDEWLPTLALPESFDVLLARHSANFRSEVRRRRRRFAEKFPQAHLESISTPAAITGALQHLFRLHNLRRAQKSGSGIFESARLRAFHLRAAPALAHQGVARLYCLRSADAVLAVLYGFEAGPRGTRRFLYFQSGFDSAITAFSPGTVLLSAVIEDCMARGLQRFDFLRGTESYKARWTSDGHASLRLLASHGFAGTVWMGLRAHRQRWQQQRKMAA